MQFRPRSLLLAGSGLPPRSKAYSKMGFRLDRSRKLISDWASAWRLQLRTGSLFHCRLPPRPEAHFRNRLLPAQCYSTWASGESSGKALGPYEASAAKCYSVRKVVIRKSPAPGHYYQRDRHRRPYNATVQAQRNSSNQKVSGIWLPLSMEPGSTVQRRHGPTTVGQR